MITSLAIGDVVTWLFAIGDVVTWLATENFAIGDWLPDNCDMIDIAWLPDNCKMIDNG